jgi:hypothetical protein
MWAIEQIELTGLFTLLVCGSEHILQIPLFLLGFTDALAPANLHEFLGYD